MSAVEVLNGVLWSEALDDTFRAAYQRDAELGWQYFCSVTGFLRHFPGSLLAVNSPHPILLLPVHWRRQGKVQGAQSPNLIFFVC